MLFTKINIRFHLYCMYVYTVPLSKYISSCLLNLSVSRSSPLGDHISLSVSGPDPDPLVRGTDPDPSIIKQR
jgi:hypothetical protein